MGILLAWRAPAGRGAAAVCMPYRVGGLRASGLWLTEGLLFCRRRFCVCVCVCVCCGGERMWLCVCACVCVCVRTHKNDAPATRTHVHAEAAPFGCGWGRVYNRFWKKICTRNMYVHRTYNSNMCVYIMCGTRIVCRYKDGKKNYSSRDEIWKLFWSSFIIIFFFPCNLYSYIIMF